MQSKEGRVGKQLSVSGLNAPSCVILFVGNPKTENDFSAIVYDRSTDYTDYTDCHFDQRPCSGIGNPPLRFRQLVRTSSSLGETWTGTC